MVYNHHAKVFAFEQVTVAFKVYHVLRAVFVVPSKTTLQGIDNKEAALAEQAKEQRITA